MKFFYRLGFCLAVILVLLSVSACNDDDGDPSSIALISSAQNEIAKTQPDAYIVWAGGRRADGSATSGPSAANTWDFTAVNTSVPQTLAWNLMLSDGNWTTTVPPFPPMGITYTDLTDVAMEASTAWSLAKGAGVSENLRTWELYKELAPGFPNPLFLIVLESGRKIFVDSVTGDVWFDVLPGAAA